MLGQRRHFSSNNMSNPVSDDLKERDRINTLILRFYALDSWTPAMGAMLMAGVIPTPGCTDILAAAFQIENEARPATPYQIHQAQKVLDRWVEYHTDEDTDEFDGPTEMSPLDFMVWCDESYDSSPASFKPDWLPYFYSFITDSTKSQAPIPAPFELVARAHKLESWAAISQEKSASVGRVNAPVPEDIYLQAEARIGVRKNVISQSGKPNTIEHELRIAQAASANPADSFEVWGHLCAMARCGRYVKLTATPDGGVMVATSTGRTRAYSQKLVKRFIDKEPRVQRDRES